MNLESMLMQATANWTLPAVIREYKEGSNGQKEFASEVPIMERHGYTPAMQSQEGGHVHAGRLLLTGGLSVFAGGRGIRAKGKTLVTFQKKAPELAGFTHMGQFFIRGSGVPGLPAGETIGVALSDHEFALLDPEGQPGFRLLLEEVEVSLDDDAIMIRRQGQPAVVLGTTGGQPARVLRDAIASRQRPAAAAAPVQDIPDQLRKLGELRDAGILTSEEFDAKKTDLLSRL